MPSGVEKTLVGEDDSVGAGVDSGKVALGEDGSLGVGNPVSVGEDGDDGGGSMTGDKAPVSSKCEHFTTIRYQRKGIEKGYLCVQTKSASESIRPLNVGAERSDPI